MNRQDAQALVNRQADEEALWCEAATPMEDMLQRALRELHAAIEGTAGVRDARSCTCHPDDSQALARRVRELEEVIDRVLLDVDDDGVAEAHDVAILAMRNVRAGRPRHDGIDAREEALRLAGAVSAEVRAMVDAMKGPQEGAKDEQLKAIADEFRKALPTPDGAVLAAMIEQGVTVLESHIRYALGVEGCPNAAHMGEHACANRHQCWEPCGELGKSAEHARPGRQDPAIAGVDLPDGAKR